MIELRGLGTEAGAFRLRGVTLSVGAGEYIAVTGPTGSGKTVLLESIAGLRRNAKGTVFIRGEDVSRWPPEWRGIGYVPQDRVLFPFLDVRENIAFPLRLRGAGRAEIQAALSETAAMLGIEGLLGRRVGKLSGGEAQRVALARALVVKPAVLLLDEPFGSIHPALRRKLWHEIEALHRRTGFTAVHVTHDPEEAAALASRSVLLVDGAIERIGAPEGMPDRGGAGGAPASGGPS